MNVQNPVTTLRRSESASPAATSCAHVVPSRPLLPSLIAAWAGFAAGTTAVSAQEAADKPANQPTQAPSASVQGRQHPSYQVFAHDLVLAAIKVQDKTTVEVGEKLAIDIS